MTQPSTTESKTPEKPVGPLRRFFSVLGPGLVTGAADDDPSGVATYSIAGAQMGTSLLWLAWLTFPLMAAVQMMCARIGMVTGMGLAGALGKKFPRPLLIIVCLSLLGANTINIAADLAGMADATQILTGLPAHVCILLFGALTALAIVRFRYYSIASILKWLTLALFAYVATAFLVHPDWSAVLADTIHVTMPRGKEAWQTVVAILGTTISPYLFFWQAAQEIEEQKSQGRNTLEKRQGATRDEIKDRIMDVTTGAVFSNLVMFFIILTTALTLHKNGMTSISSSREAAEALKPLAGNLAMLLYTTGIVGVGLLAIPTLAGSSAYAFAEVLKWPQGLDKKFAQARLFYGIILLSILLGMLLNFFHINPMKALFWSAVINGVVAPFLLLGIWIIARDRRLMQDQPSSGLSQAVVGFTTLLMFAAAIGMFLL